MKPTLNKFRYLKEIIDFIPDATLVIDRDGVVVAWNPAIEEMTGVKAEDMLGKGNYEYALPFYGERRPILVDFVFRYHEEVANRYRFIRREGDMLVTETEVPKVKGKSCILWGKAAPIYDEDGNVVGAIEVIRDVTDKWELTERLQRSEEKYREIFEKAICGIFQCTSEGNFITVNPAMAAMCGYDSPEEMVSTVTEVSTQFFEDYSRWKAFIEVLKEQNQINNFVCQVLSKKGEKIWVSVDARAVIDRESKKVFFEGFVSDITKLREAQENLLKNEARYREILDSIGEVYFETDLRGNFVFVNKTIKEVAGYDVEEMIGRNFKEFLNKDDVEKVYEVFGKVYRTGSPGLLNVCRFYDKSGNAKFLEARASIMKNDDGKPVGFRGLVRDITEHVKTEEEKRQLHAQFLEAQKLEAIGSLAGGIAHDFNNLLMGMLGCISIMKLDLSDDHPYMEKINILERLIQNGSDLTRQLLGFARGGRYEITTVNINEVIKFCADVFARTRKDISVSLDLEAFPSSVEADKGQIEQVLFNLLVNAGEAMPLGGELYIRSFNAVLNEEKAGELLVSPGLYIGVSVQDTGVGIAESDINRIFEPFFTTKKDRKSSGLGLASVYGILRSHQGGITVSSRLGEGSTFTFYLPESFKEAVETVTSWPDEISFGQGNILLVDDEDMNIQVVREMLEFLGYRVFTAGSGQEALAVFAEKGSLIDLVILDMIMPGISGKVTYERLRAMRPDVKVLLCSGYSMNGQAQEMLRMGCQGFIQKPFSIEELSRKLSLIIKGC
ncbi:MAG: PAS domain S-box protein [Syntrophales bacterium]|nr:PAS domain S-box protein [Syntrophales bacterium]